MNFKVITAVWNAAPFFERCVESIATQRVGHNSYEVVVVDDASNDGTTEMVVDFCSYNGWTYILNDVNRGALYNQVAGIRALDCGPDDVLVFLDGDDRFAHDMVFQTLERYYEDTDAQLTFGQYEPDPPSNTCTLAAPYPQIMFHKRNFREVAAQRGGIYWNHLRTFKHRLFAELTDDDFKDETDNFYRTATDACLMYPCVELAAPYVTFIPEVLLKYTSDNPLADWRRQARQCDHDHDHILRRPPKKSLFDGR